jgi:hypothetical protein
MLLAEFRPAQRSAVSCRIRLDCLPGDVHTLRVYTRWLYTRGERDTCWQSENDKLAPIPNHDVRYAICDYLRLLPMTIVKSERRAVL